MQVQSVPGPFETHAGLSPQPRWYSAPAVGRPPTAGLPITTSGPFALHSSLGGGFPGGAGGPAPVPFRTVPAPAAAWLPLQTAPPLPVATAAPAAWAQTQPPGGWAQTSPPLATGGWAPTPAPPFATSGGGGIGWAPAPQPAPPAATVAQAPVVEEVAMPPVIPVWYPAENNWQQCLERMSQEFDRIKQEFSGEWSEEQRLVKQTRLEQAADLLHQQTGGMLGKQYQPRTQTAQVVDIYQDWRFPGDATSWYRGGERGDWHELRPPATWKRLQELTLDTPYPSVDETAGILQPRGGRVYQGALEDFYLVAGMQAVGMKPKLIADLFVGMEYSSQHLGVFTLRLYKHGQWHEVQIDDALPFDKDLNPLCSTSEFFPGMAWPCLVEKAYAKLHGSWEGLGGGGHIEEVLTDLTGGCSTRYGTTDVAGDRLWQYLYEMQAWCVFACNINEAECSKRSVPIDKHWASSIWRVAKHGGVPYVCVCTAAPAATVRHLPVCDVPSEDGYGINDGFAWLRIDDFVAFFDTVYECRLVNTDLGELKVSGVPCSPGWVTGYPWFEEMWAFQGNVFHETAPAFLIEVLDVPSVITLEVSQTDMRYSDPHEAKEQGRGMQAPLLLRFYQCSREVSDQAGGEIYMVHMSAWGHTRDASCGVKVMRPGKFLAMVSLPMKYTCHKMIFRSYSTRPLAMKPVTQHRSWIMVNPAMPLDAIPYSLGGFQRVDAYSERLPQMFDEAEGRGKPMANGLGGSLTGKGSHRMQADGWRGKVEAALERAGGNRSDGLKVVGKFGGQDAIATVEAKETQDGCSIA